MANDVFSVQFTGRLVADPDMKYNADTRAITRATVASGKARQRDGEWIEHTAFVRVTAFGRLGEKLGVLGKGNQVLVTGELTVEKSTDKNGKEWTNLEVLANSVMPISTVKATPVESSEEETEEETAPTGGAPW